MSKLRYALACAAAFFVPLYAMAEDQCAVIIQHGIYDKIREKSANSNANEITHALCSAESNIATSSHGGSLAGGYDGYDLKAGYNDSQINAIRKALCSSDYSSDKAQADIDNLRSTISPIGMKGFVDCEKLHSHGLFVDSNFDEEAGTGFVTTVRYELPPGVHGGKIVYNGVIKPADVKCQGSLTRLTVGRYISTGDSYDLDCRRTMSHSPFRQMNKLVYATPKTITIGFSIGSVSQTMGLWPAEPIKFVETIPAKDFSAGGFAQYDPNADLLVPDRPTNVPSENFVVNATLPHAGYYAIDVLWASAQSTQVFVSKGVQSKSCGESLTDAAQMNSSPTGGWGPANLPTRPDRVPRVMLLDQGSNQIFFSAMPCTGGRLPSVRWVRISEQ